MNKAVSIAILAFGVVLLSFGINAHESVFPAAQEAVSGPPGEKGMWLILLVVLGMIIGDLGSFFRRGGF